MSTPRLAISARPKRKAPTSSSLPRKRDRDRRERSQTAKAAPTARAAGRGKSSSACALQAPRAKSLGPRLRAGDGTDRLVEHAAQSTLAANPLIGIRREDVRDAAQTLLRELARRPRTVLAQARRLVGELVAVARGTDGAPAINDDRRFADPSWRSNAWFRRLLQAYLALGRTLERCVDAANLERVDRERARFLVSLLVDALAPTNFLVTNPAALRKLGETRGASGLRGLANFVEDLASGRGLPRQVDVRPFKLGGNLAATRGSVVYRDEMLELIQYASTTAEVHERPLLIVPPQINKYYVFDLARDKSVVEWALAGGVQTFALSWRNPTREHADWGLDAYVFALERAVDAVREICGAADVNLWGACSGGITLSAFLGYLAAARKPKVHTATIAVCVLDTAAARDTTAGLFVTPGTIAAAKKASRARGVLEGEELARMFAWMRPNDLVWNYVVNNYLLGNEPPAFDVLYWNNDSTRLPARLHADFLALYESNPFPRRGALRVRGRRVDLGRSAIETYVVGGLTDHITPWHGVYKTAQLFGGERSTFVLSNGGHIQSLINPPGNPRAWFMVGPAREATPEAWQLGRTKSEGSWWPHWREWLCVRSGALRPAPAAIGSARHTALGPAPGSYALER